MISPDRIKDVIGPGGRIIRKIQDETNAELSTAEQIETWPGDNFAPGETFASETEKLNEFVMRCLEKNRTRRYDTATGLAADINRHLNDEPVV